MSSYLYDLPTTGAISFAEICQSVDVGDGGNGTAGASGSGSGSRLAYITEIAETTEARANLRSVLKANRRTDNEEKDFLKVVKVSNGVYRVCVASDSNLEF